MRQPSFSSSCTQRTPAGLPFGIPGIGELIDGAVQQAPHPGRQANGWSFISCIGLRICSGARGSMDSNSP
jgi:hypothetical protein